MYRWLVKGLKLVNDSLTIAGNMFATCRFGIFWLVLNAGFLGVRGVCMVHRCGVYWNFFECFNLRGECLFFAEEN